jgi:hypothetical protein
MGDLHEAAPSGCDPTMRPRVVRLGFPEAHGPCRLGQSPKPHDPAFPLSGKEHHMNDANVSSGWGGHFDAESCPKAIGTPEFKIIIAKVNFLLARRRKVA